MVGSDQISYVPSPSLYCCFTKPKEEMATPSFPNTPTTSQSAAPLFQLKQKVYAPGPDGAPRRAIVIDMANDEDGMKYYVRFAEHDSRLDTWFHASLLRPCDVRIPSRLNTVITHTITTRRMAENPQRARSPEEPPKKQSAPNTEDSIKRARKDSSFFSRPKNIQRVLMGRYDVDAWYFSPYHCARPQVRSNIEVCAPCFITDTVGGEVNVRQSPMSSELLKRNPSVTSFNLHVCPYCLEPFTWHMSVERHLTSVCQRRPPGNEVYRDIDHNIIVFELDGKGEPHFCKNIALLSKLFLEHKALDYDMSPFLFYVLCKITPMGCEVLGYFSKEKVSPDGFNLSCILTLPQFQSKGIGRFLIEVSYELSKREGKCGSPEKPLSDLGEVTYLSYWKDAVMDVLTAVSDKGSGVSIEAVVAATSLTQQDVMTTLQKLNVLSWSNVPAPGGQAVGVGAPRGQKKCSLCITSEHIRQHEEKKARRLANSSNFLFDPALLHWSPSWYLQSTEPKTPVVIPTYLRAATGNSEPVALCGPPQ